MSRSWFQCSLRFAAGLLVPFALSCEVPNAEPMVEEVFQFDVDQKLIDRLYCPTCRLELRRTDLLDPFVQGLICRNGHRFFITLQAPTSVATEQAAAIQLGLEDTNPSQIIKMWLTNYPLRSKLNEQLATMIRRIYEIEEQSLHIATDANAGTQAVFRYCPLCQDNLVLFDQSDAWVEGFRCAKGHEYRARDGLSFFFDGKLVKFHEEMADSTLDNLIGFCLKDHPNDPQVHRQIRSILQGYLNKRKPVPGRQEFR